MQILRCLWLVSFFAPVWTHGALFLEEGASYTFEFTRFNYQATSGFSPGARVGLTLRDFTGFEGEDTIRFEAFENTTNEAPVFATNLIANAGDADFSFGAAWQDFQGVFRVTMVSGSATLPGFFGSVITANGELYALKVVLQPQLYVSRRADSELHLLWPTNMLGFRLETAEELINPNWTKVTNAVGVDGKNHVVSFTPNDQRRFFRLCR